MPRTIAPATVCSASAKPPFGYASVGVYDVARATRSSVAIAPSAVLFTNARWGRPVAGLLAIVCAAVRSCVAAVPRFGLAYVYVLALGMAGTPVVPEINARGV